MSDSALKKLQILFQNRPEVLQMLDLRELELANLEDREFIKRQAEKELFPNPVNLYATGKTGAGKTTLGRSILDPKQTINTKEAVMGSTGKTDCTSMVQFFEMLSNLRYYDLPGAGGCSESYENINRAALLIPQEKNLELIDNFELWNCSNYPTKPVEQKEVQVDAWQSPENQEYVAPDIIVYVVAPHTQFTRDDKNYLIALLESQKSLQPKNKVVFALNIHSVDRNVITTKESLEDAETKITKIYGKFYSDKPPIVKVDCMSGAGINKIIEFMCQILPENKIGNMKEALRDEFKNVAKKERSRRYRQTLIYIASRLATEKVDEKLGDRGLLNEAYEAVCGYGIKVFIEEDAHIEYQKAAYNAIDSYVAKTQASRQEQVKKKVKDVEKKEVEVEKIVGYEPEFQDVTITDQVLTFESQTKKKKRSKLSRVLLGVTETVSQVALAPISMIQGIGNVCGVTEENVCKEVHKSFNDAAYEEVEVVIPRTKEVTRNEQRLVNIKERKAKVMEMVYNVVEKEQVVGKNYLQGGYPVVENLLAIGLGIEKAESSKGLSEDFEAIVRSGRIQVQSLLGRYKNMINELVVKSDPATAEEQIIRILNNVLLT